MVDNSLCLYLGVLDVEGWKFTRVEAVTARDPRKYVPQLRKVSAHH